MAPTQQKYEDEKNHIKADHKSSIKANTGIIRQLFFVAGSVLKKGTVRPDWI
jgi:hypothetical protein